MTETEAPTPDSHSNHPELMDDHDARPPRADNPVQIEEPEYIRAAIARRRAERARSG